MSQDVKSLELVFGMAAEKGVSKRTNEFINIAKT